MIYTMVLTSDSGYCDVLDDYPMDIWVAAVVRFWKAEVQTFALGCARDYPAKSERTRDERMKGCV